MHSKLADWRNGWFGVELGVRKDEIDTLIGLLSSLKENPDQHFHLSSDYKDSGGLGDVMIYVQPTTDPNNMLTLGKALGPGEKN